MKGWLRGVLPFFCFFAPSLWAYTEGDFQDPAQRQQFMDVAKQLRCPTCTGMSVLESDADFSVQIKKRVHDDIAAGKSQSQILKEFTERYGPWILREPPKQGFHALAWALPIGIMLVGPLLVWLLFWKKRQVVDSGGVRSIAEILGEWERDMAAARQGRADR